METKETITIDGVTYRAAEGSCKLPRVLRHHMSGVWIGYVLGEGSREDTIRFFGRRIWSWNGGRLETTQLATRGCTGEDKLGDVVETEIGQIREHLVDAIVSTEEVVDKSLALKGWEG